MQKRSRCCHLIAAASLAVTPMALADSGSVQTPIAPPTGVDLTADYVPGEVIITFDNVPTNDQLDAISSAYGVTAVRGMRHAPHPKNDPTGVHPLALVRIVTLPTGVDALAASLQIQNLPGVRYANPNWLTVPAFDPDDPQYLDGTQYGPQIIEAPAAWDTEMGANTTVVAVADTGFNYNHEDLQGMLWVNDDDIPGNGIDDDNNGYIDDVNGWNPYSGTNNIWDDGGHGSHVSGILAARTNNTKGIAGMAQVTIMPIKVFGTWGGTWEALAESLYYAVDNGAAVYNISGGGGGGTPDLAAGVDYAYNNGMAVICAAGNYNSSSLFYPAAYTNAIAVSGTDRFDQRYTSSNYGNWIDVAAPGVDVYSCLNNSPNAYDWLTGTSMSSPHVCGLAALCLTIDPTLTPDEIRALLRDNADDLGNPGFDIYFGYGRINARRTVEALDVPCPADLTGDGYVGQDDLGELLGSYGQDDGGDIDGDGDTDQADLGELLGMYGQNC